MKSLAFAAALCGALAAAAADEAACRAFHAPYRMDDFAWENDCLGMRAYGPAIMEPAPKGQGLVSSGFDVFCKKVSHPVLEKWLHGKGEGSYHHDRGEGMDNYKVGSSRGCGGVGMLTGGKWSYERNWRTCRVVSEKPDEAVFELGYGLYTIRGTVTKGCPMVRFDVRLNPGASLAAGTLIGPGLDVSPKRHHNGLLKLGFAPAFVANWEPEGVDGEKGSIGTAIVLPGKATMAADGMDCLHLLQGEKTFTYYAGSCWSEAGRFADAAAWHRFVADFAEKSKR